MIEKLVDESGNELIPPFTYLFNKSGDLDKLEIRTQDPNLV